MSPGAVQRIAVMRDDALRFRQRNRKQMREYRRIRRTSSSSWKSIQSLVMRLLRR